MDGYLHIKGKLSIPLEQIEIKAIRAGGAGGQHVNKVSTAVQLRFDIPKSSLPETIKKRLLAIKDSRITSDGTIIIKAQEERSQKKNKDIALSRLKDFILGATTIRKQRKATKPTVASQKKRVDEKRKHSQTKALRQKVKNPGSE